jgi:hypothetical protein
MRGRKRQRASRNAAPTIPHAVAGTAGKGRSVRTRNPIRRFLAILGPGLIASASDDDPSGIGTYAVAGASLGYATLWTALLTFPMMTAVQFMCAKIGMVTGMGLARVLRQHYPKALLYPVVAALVIANTINVGADIGEPCDAAEFLRMLVSRDVDGGVALGLAFLAGRQATWRMAGLARVPSALGRREAAPELPTVRALSSWASPGRSRTRRLSSRLTPRPSRSRSAAIETSHGDA